MFLCWFTIGFHRGFTTGLQPPLQLLLVLWRDRHLICAARGESLLRPLGFQTFWGPTCDVVVDAVQGSCMVQMRTSGLAFKDWIFFEKPGFKQHGIQWETTAHICFMLCWNPFANYRETLKHRVRYLYLPRVYTNRSTRKKHREHYGQHYILRMVCFFGVLWSQVKLNLIFCFNPLWHFFTFLCAFVKWWASWATTNWHVFLASLQTTIWEHIFFTFSKHLEQIQGFILSNRKRSSLRSTTGMGHPQPVCRCCRPTWNTTGDSYELHPS